MCVRPIYARVKTGKLSSPSGCPVPCRRRVESHAARCKSLFHCPWFIRLLRSHQDNTGLGIICRGFGLTCQQGLWKGKPSTNRADQEKRSLPPWLSSKTGGSCRDNTAGVRISTMADRGHRAGSNDLGQKDAQNDGKRVNFPRSLAECIHALATARPIDVPQRLPQRLRRRPCGKYHSWHTGAALPEHPQHTEV